MQGVFRFFLLGKGFRHVPTNEEANAGYQDAKQEGNAPSPTLQLSIGQHAGKQRTQKRAEQDAANSPHEGGTGK